ncbi:hypothetical protein [Thermomonospora catenispora]|uniref:hypothetical protein n=1 Tax=Thermomonospora catenispora TaxID=2493090 RepID=UPI00111EDD56|nr:hypothetical protein [Thermomonospora catenispora]TNY36214.1 hypothetical protein EIO00_14070 [Thermomonospora catenispora]
MRKVKLAGGAVAGTLALTPVLVLATATPAQAPTDTAPNPAERVHTSSVQHPQVAPDAAGDAGTRAATP